MDVNQPDFFQQLVAGLAADASARRAPPPPPPPPRRDVVEVSARDLLQAIRESGRPQLIGADAPQRQQQDFPWGALLGVGLLAGVALGVAIALLARGR